MRPHLFVDIEFFEPDAGGQTEQQILEKLAGKKNPVLCFVKSGEPSFAKSWLTKFSTLVKNLRKTNENLTVHLSASVYYQSHKKELECIVDSLLFFHFGLARTYFLTNLVDPAKLSPTWNRNSNKFLFLTGKPDRLHRVGLLYLFYRNDLLKHCVWSLFKSDSHQKRSKEILEDLGCLDSDAWIDKHLSNPDQIDLTLNNRGIHYSGFPFRIKLYDDAKFQVISETEYHKSSPVWTTEKTMLAIANNNPFLMAGVPQTLDSLKTLGFRTFENYCLYQDYDNINDELERLAQIVENTKFWLDNIENFATDIEKDVVYNFSRFQELGQQYKNQAQDKIRQLDIDCLPEDLLAVEDQISKAEWKNWYIRIKDSSWPDCSREEDFHLLPLWIQKECIEVFGYTPKEKT